jgi:predicted glycosyltransferase
MMKENGLNHQKIWIDLDNTPHIPFFFPVIRELEARGYSIVLTARDCYQVCGLAKLFHLDCSVIGRHYGKNRWMKIAGALMRSCQLMNFARKHRPDIALSHGSRAQIIAASLLGISTFVAIDYEHGQQLPFFCADLYMVPEVLARHNPWPSDAVRSYPGIKEDVYVPSFIPDNSILAALRIDPAAILMTVRPPATEAHYHNPDGEKLFAEVLDCYGAREDIVMVILPRNNGQAEHIQQKWPDLLAAGRLIIPEQVVDGLNLMWHSDLVVSGGGTMNREAAALGVPVYSIFKGSIGAVDRYLEEKGRLILLDTPQDVREKIRPVKRQRKGQQITRNQIVLRAFVNEIIRAAETRNGRAKEPKPRSASA